MDSDRAVEAISLLILLCNNQNSNEICIAAIRKQAAALVKKKQLIPALQALAPTYQVSPFVTALVHAFLEVESKEVAEEAGLFLSSLVEEVRFVGGDPAAIIS